MNLISLRLRGKMTVSVVSIALVGILVTAGMSVFISRNIIEEQAIALSNKVAEGNATFVEAELERSFVTARNIATTLYSMKADGTTDRDLSNGILRRLLEESPKLLATWTVWEPNAFGADAQWVGKPYHDQTGRFIPYWYRSDGKVNGEPIVDYEKPGAGDYYILAQQSGEEIIMDPYIYSVGGVDTIITSLVVPIAGNGPRPGVGGIDIALSDIQKQLGAIRPFGEGYLTLVSSAGSIVSHPDGTLLTKSVEEAGFSKDILSLLAKGKMITLPDTTVGGVEVLQVITPLHIGATKTPWSLIVTVPRSKIFEASNEMMLTISLVTILLVLVSAGAAVLFATTLSKPIVKLTDVMGELASGDLEAEIPTRSQSDEIGEMVQAVQVFKDNALKVQRMERERDQRAQQRQTEEKAAREKIVADFQASVGSVVDTVSQSATEMQSYAEILEPAALQTQSQAQAGASAAEMTSQSVQAVSSAAEELTASIQEIGMQANSASKTAASAVAKAEETNHTVAGLTNAVARIGEVINLIDAIAEQTNLLALNATIEAARAGDAGKGFAVVASEVKNLASQTAQATQNITDQIGAVQTATEEAASAIADVTTTIGEIDAFAAAIAAAVEEQGAATNEIARSSEQAASGTHKVTGSIADIEEAATGASTSANNVKTAATQLGGTAEELHSRVSEFISLLRA